MNRKLSPAERQRRADAGVCVDLAGAYRQLARTKLARAQKVQHPRTRARLIAEARNCQLRATAAITCRRQILAAPLIDAQPEEPPQ